MDHHVHSGVFLSKDTMGYLVVCKKMDKAGDSNDKEKFKLSKLTDVKHIKCFTTTTKKLF